MKSNINEGLKAHTLDHLILPLLTIDEYESKIDDNRVIVVGFFVFDKDPAEDLSSFIDKGSIAVLDTEVSPAPTPEGYYVVFVEIFRNSDFPSTLLKTLKEVQNLCDITQWQMQCPGHEDPIDLSEEAMHENLILDPEDLENDTDETVKKKKKKKKKNRKRTVSETANFWVNSQVDQIQLENDIVTFIKNGREWSYQIDQDIPISNINLLESTDTAILQNLLGPSYTVWAMRDTFVVEHNDNVRVLKNIS